MVDKKLDNNRATEVFLSLLMANQTRIRAYIAALVPNSNDADDIMQETITVMWSKFADYEVGSNFSAWGTKIAYYNILTYRRKKSKTGLHFSEDLFERFMEAADRKYSTSDERLQALRNCVKKLVPADRKLLKLRYDLNSTVKHVAGCTGEPVKRIYRALARTHHKLYRCVRRTLVEKGVI